MTPADADDARRRPLQQFVVVVHATLAVFASAAGGRTLLDAPWAGRLDPLLLREAEAAPVLAALTLVLVAVTYGLVAWMLARRAPGAVAAAGTLFVVTLPLGLLWSVTGATWAVLFVFTVYGGTTLLWATDPSSRPCGRRPRPQRAGPSIVQRVPPARAFILFIALGIVARIVAVFTMDVQWDGATYAAMGHVWSQHGAFLMPWGTLVSDTYTPQYSHHYPPLWPVWLGMHYKLLGFGAWQTHLAALVMSLVALLVVYVLTRDLYGRMAALGTTAVLAVDPHLVWATGTGFAENLVLLLFALTLWGILRSLDRPAFVLVAGLAAGLAYLTRSSMGPFFIIAGFGGFAWRFMHRRWRVFTDHAYLAAAGIFLLAVTWWAWRNMTLHGGMPWESSGYVTRVIDHAFDDPSAPWTAWAYKLPFFAFLLAPFVLLLWPGLRRGLAAVRSEHESALWLAVGLVTLLGWILAGLFWTWEGTSLFWSDNRRYLIVAVLPLLWIGLRPRHDDSGERAERGDGLARTLGATDRRDHGHAPPLAGRTILLCIVLLVVTGGLFVVSVTVPEAQAAASLELPDGAVVGYDGVTNRYAMYPYLPHHDLTVMRVDAPGAPVRFDAIVSLEQDRSYDGYEKTGTFVVERGIGSDRTATVWTPTG